MTTNPFASDPNPYQAPSESRMAPGGMPGGAAWITPTVIELLSQTRPWVLFLSILGFISSGLMAIVGVIGGVGGLAFARAGGAQMAVVMLVYPLMGLIYFFPSLYLFRFAQAIRDLRDAPDVLHLENALGAQKSFWKFVGIIAALVIALYVAIIAIAAVIGVIAAVSR